MMINGNIMFDEMLCDKYFVTQLNWNFTFTDHTTILKLK